MRLYAGLEWPKLQRYEIETCRRCDLVLVVSEEDKATLLGLEPSLTNVRCVPIGVDVDHFQPVVTKPGSLNLLSIGTMYLAAQRGFYALFQSRNTAAYQAADPRLHARNSGPAACGIDPGAGATARNRGHGIRSGRARRGG